MKEQIEQIRKGTEMTSSVMDKVLGKFGVVQYDPIGEKFNPNLHEAVFMLSQSDYANNHVGQVMQSGFKIGDRILRAAKVGIVKK